MKGELPGESRVRFVATTTLRIPTNFHILNWLNRFVAVFERSMAILHMKNQETALLVRLHLAKPMKNST